tara:strand:- start:2765 stop:3436 length:672 start_codon:yes stop_codon:yes gene_type:complete
MSNDQNLLRLLIRENIKSDAPEKLRVLDFDDTIAHTSEKVRIETPNGPDEYKLISSDEFAIYDLRDSEYFHPTLAFKQFRKIDVEKAAPVPFVSDLFKTFVSAQGNRKILILTARGEEVRPFVMKFLEKKLGISNPEERVDFAGVGSKEPLAKVKIIKQYIRNNPSIRFISFYDDSGKNVKAVKSFINKINFKRDDSTKIGTDIRQVVEDEDGNILLKNIYDD